jgi:hypothetical protein
LDVASSIKFKEQSGNGNLIFVDQGKKKDKEFLFAMNGSGIKESDLVELPSHPMKNDEFCDQFDRDLRLYKINDGGMEDIYFKGIPHKSILETDYCYIYTSSEEVFVWNGKKSTIQMKRLSKALGKKIANDLTKKSSYVTYTREIQDGESTLFKEKFIGFPSNLAINVSSSEVKGGNIAEKKEQKELKMKPLFEAKLETSIEKDGNIPSLESGNLSMEIIDMEKHDKIQYPTELYGQFYMEDAYIIHFSFEKVKGGKVYNKVFFWQGKDSKRNTKGTSAYKTVEFTDKLEDSEQIRVVQGKEPLSFLKLFKNKYICHKGSFFKKTTKKKEKIFKIKEKRNNLCYPVELDEFHVNYVSNHHSFIFLKEDEIFLFHGDHSTKDERENASHHSRQLSSSTKELKDIREIFSNALELNKGTNQRVTSRLFEFSDQTGMVNVEEIPFFDQSDLDTFKIYILDSYPHLFL